MGTSKRFKPTNPCTFCGNETVNMSREEQDKHEEKHRGQSTL